MSAKLRPLSDGKRFVNSQRLFRAAATTHSLARDVLHDRQTVDLLVKCSLQQSGAGPLFWKLGRAGNPIFASRSSREIVNRSDHSSRGYIEHSEVSAFGYAVGIARPDFEARDTVPVWLGRHSSTTLGIKFARVSEYRKKVWPGFQV